MTEECTLPLETARRVAQAAVSSLDASLRLEPNSIAPLYSWVSITVSARNRLGYSGDLRRNTRESLRVLTALAACRGYAVSENRSFWSQVWPDDPAWQHQQPQWAAKWRDLHLRGRPAPAGDSLRFLLRTEDVELGERARADAVALVEDLFLARDSDEQDSVGFRHTMALLSKHIEPAKWPRYVACGVESLYGDINRWSRLCRGVAQAKNQSKTVDRIHIPLQLTECFLSAQHCLERSGMLKDMAAALEPQSCQVPIRELKLHFGWNSTERSLDKRLWEFKLMMWHMAQDARQVQLASPHLEAKRSAERASGVRVLQLTGRCLADASFYGALCSAIPFTKSLEELRVVLPPLVRSDTRSLLWRWLAVSVFHPQSRATVKSLDLSQCNISLSDVDAVRDAVKKDWSAATVELIVDDPALPLVPPSKGSTIVALVKSNTRIEAEPVRRLFSRPLTTLKHVQEFTVVCLLDEWICVHLPGFGCGFIKGQSVVSLSERPTAERAAQDRLTSLKLKTVDIEATMALLEVIGGHLKYLHLECEGFTNAHVDGLMRCCPKLTHLTLRSGKFNDFSALVDASVAGRCQVSSLNLLSRRVTASCLEHLTAKLSDSKLASASGLRELRLQTGLLTRSDLECLLQLLKGNRTLRCLHIKISFNLFDEFMPRFLAHRGDWLQGSQEDRRKLAFVSALTREDCARRRIDASMLRNILSFACHGERLVSLDEYTDRMTIQEIIARTNAV